MPNDNPPAGFESHWDAPWFSKKADECRRIASLMSDTEMKGPMLDLANDLQRQSNHAALLAAVAFGKGSLATE